MQFDKLYLTVQLFYRGMLWQCVVDACLVVLLDFRMRELLYQQYDIGIGYLCIEVRNGGEVFILCLPFKENDEIDVGFSCT